MPDLTPDTVRTLLDAGAVHVDTYLTADGAPDFLTAVVPTGYTIATVDLSEMDELRDAPRRTRGTATVTNVASWLAYFKKHEGGGAEVFGDVDASTVVGILNAPTADEPAWGDHRVVLQLTHSAAWQAWTGLNERMVSQTDFAEHLEDRTPDLVTPDAATMLELAQSFQATTGVRFESGSRLHDGQRRFTYMETIEGKAGQRGQLDIPTSISIQVPVWRGVDIAVPMTARFRFRAGPDGLRLGYVLDRLEDVLDAAWESLLAELTAALPVPVLAGRAPDYRR